MRLLLSAVAIILFFALGVWAIALLLPQDPDWLKIALAMLWLVSLCYWGILVENHRLRMGNDQRLLLLSGLLTALLMSAFLVPIFTQHVSLPRWAAEIVFAIIAIVVFMFFRRIPVHRTSDEVIAFLERVMQSGVGSSWGSFVSPRIAWESFVSTRIAEPELEAVRLRLLRLNTDSKEAFDQALQSLIAELRGRQAEVVR